MDIEKVEKFFKEIDLNEGHLIGGTSLYLPSVPKGIDVKVGCSKLVFVFDKEDKVLKIPCVSVESDDEYECRLSKCDRENTENSCSRRCDGCSNYGIGTCELSQNYCKLEEEIYLKAKKVQVERFFCKTELLGEVNDIPVYAQEKCEFPGKQNTKKTPSKNSLNLIKEKDTCFIFGPVYDAFIIDFYGINFYERLGRFIEEEGIDDFHSDNMGFRLNGEPCIFDYSGFNG